MGGVRGEAEVEVGDAEGEGEEKTNKGNGKPFRLFGLGLINFSRHGPGSTSSTNVSPQNHEPTSHVSFPTISIRPRQAIYIIWTEQLA